MGAMTAARRLLSVSAGLGCVLALAGMAGCTAVAQPDSQSSTVGTVGGVGELPPSAVATPAAAPDSGPDTSVDTAESTTTTIPPEQTIGAKAAGNRLLMIGDSLTASISKRYGGEACKALVPLGWKVEVDAEVGRFIDFGKLVLDKRLDAGWDAAVLFLGNNYGYDKAVFKDRLHALLLRLVPRPTVLVTTTLFRPQQEEVNAAIMEEAALFTSVTVIDWATASIDPSLTGGDGLHLTTAGRRTLAYHLAATMGIAPVIQPGECLKTKYTDDSAGSPYGPPGNQTAPKTTVKPKPVVTTTTTKPSGSTGSTATTTVTPSTSSGTATTAPTTQTTVKPAPTTTAAPVVTTPATTAPPVVPPTTEAKPLPPEPPATTTTVGGA